MLAIIGGTGLTRIDCFDSIGVEALTTPYGKEEVCMTLFRQEANRLVFLPRHGESHSIAPHKINYRANLWALKQLGVTHVLAVNAVGGIHPELGPGAFAVPDQIIDYTSGRVSTFYEDEFDAVRHIDFTEPYDEELRQRLLQAFSGSRKASAISLPVLERGVYGCTNGPRLETAAEVRRLRRDGCDMVGMTGMPEAALARELDIAYASLALSVNWAAGIGDEVITMEKIHEILDGGMQSVRACLQVLAAQAFS